MWTIERINPFIAEKRWYQSTLNGIPVPFDEAVARVRAEQRTIGFGVSALTYRVRHLDTNQIVVLYAPG